MDHTETIGYEALGEDNFYCQYLMHVAEIIIDNLHYYLLFFMRY